MAPVLSGADFATTQLPAFLDEKRIMAIIANKDDDLKYKKQQVELFFSVHSDTQELADYLKSAYQDRYTEIMADGQRLGYKPQEDGKQLPLFSHTLPQQVIDEALCLGANDRNSRLAICAYFKKDKLDNTRFLAEHDGENGAGFYLGGKRYALWYMPRESA